MQPYAQIAKEELIKIKDELYNEYNAYKSKNLKLDMSRGKPCKEQVELSQEMLGDRYLNGKFATEEGLDVRNYGGFDGIIEAKRLFAEIFEVSTSEVIIGGTSSLNLMYDAAVRAMLFGVDEKSAPWSQQGEVKFVCPVPGYDRHFAVLELLGIKMVSVSMNSDGPDMDEVERLIADDDKIKGIWVVPKYSNPSGITFSDEVVKRMANLKPKAADFRIFWDNAYAVHDLYDEGDKLLNIMAEAKKNGKEDMVYIFGSTAKITLPGNCVGAFISSEKNIARAKKQLSIQTINYDKANQLKHANYIKDGENLKAHMSKHAEIIRPKFEAVLSILEEELDGLKIAEWQKPRGGYFIALEALSGCAKKIVAMCKDAGVVFTPAGATHPYGVDPDDATIRIAPTFPPVEELKTAIRLFCICVKIAGIEKLLG